MYYTLPIKDRLSLMKDYRKAYPGMGYSEMVEHFNEGIKKFENGGKFGEKDSNKQYVNTNPEKSFMMSGKMPAINQDNLPNTQKRFAGLNEVLPPSDNSPMELLSAPQKLLTQAFTGKYQTPAEAMDIKNPYSAFVVDMLTDPTNLVGAGLIGKGAKLATGSKILRSTDNVFTSGGKYSEKAFRKNAQKVAANKASKEEFKNSSRMYENIAPKINLDFDIVDVVKLESKDAAKTGVVAANATNKSNNTSQQQGQNWNNSTNKLEGLNKFGSSLSKQVVVNKQAEIDKIKAKEAAAKKAAEDKAKAKKRYIPEDRYWSF